MGGYADDVDPEGVAILTAEPQFQVDVVPTLPPKVMLARIGDDRVHRAEVTRPRLGAEVKEAGTAHQRVVDIEKKDDVYFFATRLIKDRSTKNPDFSKCRKEITMSKPSAAPLDDVPSFVERGVQTVPISTRVGVRHHATEA